MTKPQFQPKDDICPYPVEEKVSAKNVEKICNKIGITLITSPEQLAKDINLYYEGYQQHKRVYSGKKSKDCTTKKQMIAELEKISNATSNLLTVLKKAQKYKDGFSCEMLNAYLHLSARRKESEVDSLHGLIKTLQALKKEADRPINYDPGIFLESTSNQWFLGKAMPEIFKKHTGKTYARSYSSDTKTYGSPHKFIKKVLEYLEDFKSTTDDAIDSAPKNYRDSLRKNKKDIEKGTIKKYRWPYEWSD